MSTVHRTSRRHLRRAAIAIGTTLATMSSVVIGVPAAGAAIRPSTDVIEAYSADLQGSKVTSSTGKTLYLGIEAFSTYDSVPVVAGEPPVVEASTSVVVSLSSASEKEEGAHPGDYEQHAWIFPSASTQELTGTSLQTGSTLGPFGSLDLTFKAKGNPVTTTSCPQDGGTAQLRDVTVSGAASFASMSTGSKAWGTVSVHSFDFSDTSTVESDSGTEVTATGCMTPIPKFACFAASDWDVTPKAAVASFTTFDGVVADGVEAIGGSKEAMIASPPGTMRVDTAQYIGAHIDVTSSAGSAKVTFSADGSGVTGSGTLTSTGTAKTDHRSCTGGSETIRAWAARYAGSTLTAHEQVFGSITLAASGDAADIEVQSK